jgi:hypothetical protein
MYDLQAKTGKAPYAVFGGALLLPHGDSCAGSCNDYDAGCYPLGIWQTELVATRVQNTIVVLPKTSVSGCTTIMSMHCWWHTW